MPVFLKMILQGLFVKFMRQKIQRGSLHAVRFYVGLVQQVRLVSMAALMVSTTAALVLVGLSFVIGSILWLLPISAASLPYAFMGVGFLMVLGGSLSLRSFFKEENWMEMSNANSLVGKVVAMGADASDASNTDSVKETVTKFANIATEAMRSNAVKTAAASKDAGKGESVRRQRAPSQTDLRPQEA